MVYQLTRLHQVFLQELLGRGSFTRKLVGSRNEAPIYYLSLQNTLHGGISAIHI